MNTETKKVEVIYDYELYIEAYNLIKEYKAMLKQSATMRKYASLSKKGHKEMDVVFNSDIMKRIEDEHIYNMVTDKQKIIDIMKAIEFTRSMFADNRGKGKPEGFLDLYNNLMIALYKIKCSKIK